jgi:hypothetical protein
MNLATAFYGTAADSCVTHRTDQRPTDAFAAGPFRFHAFFFGKIDWTACLIEHGPSGAVQGYWEPWLHPSDSAEVTPSAPPYRRIATDRLLSIRRDNALEVASCPITGDETRS